MSLPVGDWQPERRGPCDRGIRNDAWIESTHNSRELAGSAVPKVETRQVHTASRISAPEIRLLIVVSVLISGAVFVSSRVQTCRCCTRSPYSATWCRLSSASAQWWGWITSGSSGSSAGSRSRRCCCKPIGCRP